MSLSINYGTQRTPLFAKKVPGGALVITDETYNTGNKFFVHSGTGTNAAGYGWSPDAPVATVDYAVGLCTANKNDVIYVMPGHAETLSAAAGIDADVAGISIIGLGNGTNRPRFTCGTTANVDVDIDAANVTIKGLDFVAAVADVVALIDVNADYFTLEDCRFFEATDLNFKICVQDAAAGGSDFITIKNCRAHCPDAANTHFVNFAGTGDGHTIVGNVLIGDWGTMAIGGAGVVTNCVIMDNHISNIATDNDSCINLAATATGIVHRNLVSSGAAQGNAITATGTGQNENYAGVLSEDLSGILEPAGT
jgi:hypothetical protein